MINFTDGGARLHVAMQPSWGRLTVTLTGELDRVSGPALAELLDAAMDGSVGRLDVDMAQLGFVDVCGVRVLLQAHHLGARRGVVLALHQPQPHIRWLLHTTDSAALLLGDCGVPADTPLASAQVTLIERDRRADEREEQADEREELADDRDRLAQERDRYLDERHEQIQAHQRWEDIREDMANARERQLEHREEQR